MAFMLDTQELKPGLVIFRRADVQHRRWYCRVKLPDESAYKTVALKTADGSEARDKAYDYDAELRFRIKHELPVFDRKFSQVAQEFSKFQKDRSEIGEITHHRWRVIDSHIRTQLSRYVGSIQITQLGEDRWKSYPVWRQKNGKGRSGGRVSTGTIRDEMTTFRAIMHFAATKNYIPDSKVFRGKVPVARARREEFTPAEYRKLHRFARRWIKKAPHDKSRWHRQMAYNFILVMTNTGMRPSEARNLRWRDVEIHRDRQDRTVVRLSVRGKAKQRILVAAENVATYLERVRSLSKAAKEEDFVFTTDQGASAQTLYYGLINDLLKASGLLKSSSGSRRSTYCFRHTYATFRLTEGVDVYFLAKQMGTSVKMIEDHYGHITPVKSADQILKGLPGWEAVAPAP